MKIFTNSLLLSLAFLFLSINTIVGQNVQFSQQQIVGKWILKSASFNGRDVYMADCKGQVFFEFSNDGKVKIASLNGEEKEGVFLLKENKLIDPKVPEFSNADILELTDKGMILEMKEDRDKVLMRFEIDGLD